MKPRAKTTGKTTGTRVGALIKQPHGGALRNGGTNVGGTGRPPSAIREHLRGSFDHRIAVLESIADGDVLQRIDVPLPLVLQHAECPNCRSKLRATDRSANLVRIEGKISASPKDRIASLRLMGDLGLASVHPITKEQVTEKLRAMIDALRNELPTAVFENLLPKLKKVWTT